MISEDEFSVEAAQVLRLRKGKGVDSGFPKVCDSCLPLPLCPLLFVRKAVVRRDAGDLGKEPVISLPADGLGGGKGELPLPHLHPEREEKGHVLCDIDGGKTDPLCLDHQVFPGIQHLVALVMIDKDEAGPAVGAKGCSRGGSILRGRRLFRGDIRHWGETFPEVLRKQVQKIQHPVLRPRLPVLGECRVKVVVPDWVVVGIAGGAAFLKRAVLPDLVCSAVVHVVADQVVAGAELAQGQGIGIHRRDSDSPMVGGLLPRSQLAGGKGIALIGQVPAVRSGLLHQICAHCRIVPLFAEDIVGRERQGTRPLAPGGIRIGGKDREDLVHRDPRAACRIPAGHRVQGNPKADLLRHSLQRPQVLRPIRQLVLKLHGDHRAAILVEEALYLPKDGGIPPPHQLQIGRIIRAQRKALVQEPVREAPVSRLAVGPWADPQYHKEALLPAELHKGPHIVLPGKVQGSLLFLMADPEQVGGDETDAARLHLGNLPRPVRPRAAGEVKLPHDRKPGFCAPGEILTRQVNRIGVPVVSSEVQVMPQNLLRRIVGKATKHGISPPFPIPA